MQAHIQKWGNSLGLRIPMKLSQQLKLKAGSAVTLQIEQDHLVILPKKYQLEEMVSHITDANVHHEMFEGETKGREEW